MPTTETYTYDPTDDAVLVEQADARDAETLEIGEKMIEEQENLLAGKYRKPEDLEAAYLELQKKLGDQEKGLAREEGSEPEADTPAPEYYTEDGSVNYETANEFYGEQISGIFKNNEIDPFKMNEYFMENGGTLSDDMYGSLEKAGLSKEMVNTYLDGVRKEQGFFDDAEATQVDSLSEADIQGVKNLAGGDDGYTKLMDWATENLPEETCKNFDEVVETGNKAAVHFAVKALMGQYEDAVGRDASLITGKAAKTQTYRSMAEVVRDMESPQYDRDEAYRDDVRRKLEASNLKL
jgi:hypothetical protein